MSGIPVCPRERWNSTRDYFMLFVRRCFFERGSFRLAMLQRRFHLLGVFGSVKPKCRVRRLPRCWSTVMLEGHQLKPLLLCPAIRC